ncbi:penicillin acylase family protein [Fulvivirga sedimenti]|uniref:Penicillin acylase family protein n=1 Tax=Fulvivirga sedimenti TaxID=2879465 RepID=A0A9X1HPB8_9BACT|nr:penicillin acylase family protein [Fulvivirga sedimenti]MCA6074307.1 penicillin acylase family protein [Fulvivirga sedimenti]
MNSLLRILFLFFISLNLAAQPFSPEEVAAWKKQAQKVTIIRDNWGVPHIYGKTDADVIFGLMYAQCEDDFQRIEYNYIRGLGRLAELEGEGQVFNDLWARAYGDPSVLKEKLSKMDPAMKKIMQAFADGMNYFLATHPEVEPRLLTRFEPWYPLAYSEGSSEGNVSNQTDISRREIAEFFATQIPELSNEPEGESKGSNGMALGPSRTKSGKAMLLINPHVSVYHRLEAHLNSEEGLDVYGAVSKGQFFVYHGFNNYCGWMHTSSGTDTHDAFLMKVKEEKGKKYYSYGDKWREIETKSITVPYKNRDGQLNKRTFQVDYTHYGPIVTKRDEYYVAITPLHMPEKELEQEFMTMKADGLEGFKKVMSIRSNATNNTVYADVDGNIAYWNGNFVPRRNPEANYRKPVLSTPENDWKGLHELDEIIQVINPVNGWIQNCNSTPYLASGEYSPKKGDYPAYMTGHHQNPRAANAMRLLDAAKDFTADDFRQLAYDNYLQLFDIVLPPLFAAYDGLESGDDRKESLSGPVSMLRNWDRRATIEAEAVLLGEAFARRMSGMSGKYIPADTVMDMNLESFPQVIVARDRLSADEVLEALRGSVEYMNETFGSYNVPLGDVLRFQRISDHPTFYDDAKPSIPSRFLSGFLGSIPAAFYNRQEDSNKEYYAGGNSFIAVIEFGETVKARTIIGGGQSADPDSPHYNDQSEMFMKGELKEVNFTREEVEANAEKTYHPGEK